MVSSLVRLSVVAWLVVSRAEAVDLNPRSSNRDMEGARFSELRFKDGRAEISYSPPPGWTWRGGNRSLVFSAPGLVQAGAKIRVSPAAAPLGALDEKAARELREAMVTLLPAAKERMSLLSERVDPILIDGHRTFEAIFEYALYGQRFQTSLLFVDLEGQRMTVEVSARARDFKEVYGVFWKSLYSWQWHRPAKEPVTPPRES